MANQTRSSTNRKTPKNLSDSFLEAFRDLGTGMAKDAKQSIFGGSTNENSSATDLFKQEANLERKYRQQWIRSEQIRREEQVLFSRQQKETQSHVIQLQQEIKGLAQATGNLAHQVDISAMQVASDTPASIYHVNFFEHLKRLIRQLKTQINESASWMAEFNKKSKKKNAFWGGVKKQGAKFLLDPNRSAATQVG